MRKWLVRSWQRVGAWRLCPRLAGSLLLQWLGARLNSELSPFPTWYSHLLYVHLARDPSCFHFSNDEVRQLLENSSRIVSFRGRIYLHICFREIKWNCSFSISVLRIVILIFIAHCVFLNKIGKRIIFFRNLKLCLITKKVLDKILRMKSDNENMNRFLLFEWLMGILKNRLIYWKLIQWYGILILLIFLFIF